MNNGWPYSQGKSRCVLDVESWETSAMASALVGLPQTCYEASGGSQKAVWRE